MLTRRSRHNDQVVVYDSQSKRFGVRDVASQRAPELSECPYCHQPLGREDRSRGNEDDTPRSPTAAGFVSPEYFRMLRDSRPGSPQPSPPPSPRRRLVEPVRSTSSPLRSPVPATDYITDTPSPPSSSSRISAGAFSPGYFKRFFVVEKELGRGGKGVVLLVTHILDNVDLGQYACKRVPVGDDHAWLIHVLNEVRLLEHLSHQHLVYYKHVWLEDVRISTFGPSVPCAFILQQYCNAGDLHHYIVDQAQPSVPTNSAQTLKERARRRSKNQPEPPQDLQGRKLRFEEIYSFFKDITSGLNHLHVNGFIHRDLKPSNCLLHDFGGKGSQPRVLVSDFGEVQVENMVRKSTGATGTVSYCAPEVLRRSPATGELGNFTTKSDIFSLGMILYFLCFARLPYRNADHLNEENEDLDQLRDEIISWTGLHEERKLRPDLPEQLYTFLRRLLSLDPDDRPSGEEILLGIKTGSGLDEISDARPNPAAHMFDDLSASSRISPIDSPRSSTPARKKSSQTFMRPAKMRLGSFTQDSASPPPLPRKDSPTPSRSHDSLVLRPSFPPPARLLNGPLPPLPPPSRFQEWRREHGQMVERAVAGGVLLLKIASLNLLCSPMAAKTSIVYPLIVMAALDALLRSRLEISVALAIIHVAVLVAARQEDVLCVRSIADGVRFDEQRYPL